MYRLFVKRLLDIVLSAVGIVIFSPVYLLIGLMVRIQMGAPVLFSQERIGKDGKPFRIFKFRSMRKDNAGLKITTGNDSRITPVGRFLRKSKLILGRHRIMVDKPNSHKAPLYSFITTAKVWKISLMS